MAKRPKKIDEEIIQLAFKLTFITSAAFLVALSMDIYHLVQFVSQHYARNI